jgi:hypothetical protein
MIKIISSFAPHFNNNTMMDDKDKVEALIKLADIQQKGFDKRRDIEWKVSLALWAAIFIGTGFLLDHKELKYDIFLILIGYIVFCIIYFIWVGKIGNSHEIDKYYRNTHRDNIFAIFNNEESPDLGDSYDTYESKGGKKINLFGNKNLTLFYDLWLCCEIAITALFLIGSFILLYSNHNCHHFHHCCYH